MAQTTYPTGSVPATVARWARLARLIAPPCVVGPSSLGSYGLSFAGLTVTIGRGTSGVAEAWVRNFFHVLDAADEVIVVPANTNATLARIDRIVLRWNPTTETAVLALVQGTPAASPVATALTQTDTGIWELPLWRFTVPANSGSPISGVIDDRKFFDPSNPSSQPLAAYVPTLTYVEQNSYAFVTAATPWVLVNVTVPDPGYPYRIVLFARCKLFQQASVAYFDTINLRVAGTFIAAQGRTINNASGAAGIDIGETISSELTGSKAVTAEVGTSSQNNTTITVQDFIFGYRVIPSSAIT